KHLRVAAADAPVRREGAALDKYDVSRGVVGTGWLWSEPECGSVARPGGLLRGAGRGRVRRLCRPGFGGKRTNPWRLVHLIARARTRDRRVHVRHRIGRRWAAAAPRVQRFVEPGWWLFGRKSGRRRSTAVAVDLSCVARREVRRFECAGP